MWIPDRNAAQQTLVSRLHLAAPHRRKRPDKLYQRHTKCCYSDLQTPWVDSSSLILYHMDLVLQVAFTSGADTLLDWLKVMVCIVPLGVFPYFLARSWWESLPKWLPHQPHDCQPPIIMHGVDVSRSAFLMRPAVLKAAEFAAEAHTGQFRKSGQPYISHCLETALIFEDLLEPSIENDRAEAAFMAALLHDVLDDTPVPAKRIQQEFGPDVCGLVQKVSELSLMIQLLRRRKRMSNSKVLPDCGWDEEESNKLKSTILKKMQEPLVLLIKLADRLHNMRTVFALQPDKREAVAAETRDLFCTLAERLGLFALKAELDDLCFAVLEPMEFSRARYSIETLWHPDTEAIEPSSPEALVAKPELYGVSSVPVPSQLYCKVENSQGRTELQALEVPSGPFIWGETPGKRNVPEPHLGCWCALSNDVMTNEQCQELLSWVPSFQNVMYYWSSYCEYMSFGQNFLHEQTERLLHEIAIESFGAGFQIDVAGRVKSMYSAHRKMRKKKLNRVSEVLDVLGLKVVVNDDNDHEQARELCYVIMSAVQRLWKPVPQELDDYIANPKDSGYQSLHTCVVGPGNVPFEIQIRTSSMDKQAEFGSAAHWCYKESIDAEDESAQHRGLQPFYVGQPVLRIQSGCYYDGVVVQCDEDGRHALVAVRLQDQFPRKQGARAASRQDYEGLLQHVKDKGWFEAGHGNLFTALERYVLCVDGAHHRVDHYGQKESKTVVRPINSRDFFSEHDNMIGGSNALDGAHADNWHKVDIVQVQRMRLSLKYYKEVSTSLDIEPLKDNDVYVLLWPDARITCFPRGTTAADVLAEKGWIEIDGNRPSCFPPVVNVNNQLVPEETVLQDGDVLVMTREKIRV